MLIDCPPLIALLGDRQVFNKAPRGEEPSDGSATNHAEDDESDFGVLMAQRRRLE